MGFAFFFFGRMRKGNRREGKGKKFTKSDRHEGKKTRSVQCPEARTCRGF